MSDPDDAKPPHADNLAPLYIVERGDDCRDRWRIVGPYGLVGVYETESEAHGRADFLNEQAVRQKKGSPVDGGGRVAPKAKASRDMKSPMNAYDVRFSGGLVRYASASSRQAAAELALSEPASPHPPASDPSRPAACYVKEHGGSIAETPFWRAEGEDEPDTIPVEDLNSSNDG